MGKAGIYYFCSPSLHALFLENNISPNKYFQSNEISLFRPQIDEREAARNSMAHDLSADEIARYSRHLILPQVGVKGQIEISKASVLVIGAGGLGSPVLLYLAAAGVGRIGIIDDDLVELSNLQRQVIHGTPQVGLPKVASAQARIESMNPLIKVEAYHARLTAENALDIITGYDLVVDGTDNIPTRYLINDACEIVGVPWVYASIYRFEGQCTVFNFNNGPNYRDLFPTPPPADKIPSCAEGGVIGVLPGVMGTIQANEAIKIIIGKGNPISGILLVYDALETRFRGLKYGKDPSRGKVSELGTYDESMLCQSESLTHQENSSEKLPADTPISKGQNIHEISAIMANEKKAGGWEPFVLDVRTEQESEIVSLSFTDLLIPVAQVPNNIQSIPKGKDVLIYCHHGTRSRTAGILLQKMGFDVDNIYSLSGGINEWSLKVDPTLPRY